MNISHSPQETGYRGGPKHGIDAQFPTIVPQMTAQILVNLNSDCGNVYLAVINISHFPLKAGQHGPAPIAK
jgi:hypothetical protein